MPLDFGSSIGITQSGTTVLQGATTGILKPLSPAFHAHGIQGAVAQGNYIIFNLVDFNLGNYYNPSNGLFYAPVAGTYCFYGHVLSENGATGDIRHVILKNGGVYNGGWFIVTRTTGVNNGGWYSLYANAHIQMAANDNAGWWYAQGSATHTNPDYCAFGGYLIG